MAEGDDEQPIVIKKVIKKVAGGAHGGAWKVAYADFVTAMMAFFLMLWLLNVTDSQTLEGLADYFSPTVATISSDSGSGNILAGTSMSPDGSQSGGATAVRVPTATPSSQQDTVDVDTSSGDAGAESAQTDSFASTINSLASQQLEAAADRIRQAIQQTPELAEHRDQVIIEQTPDGMRIQIVDKDQRSMFRDGTPDLFDYAVTLIEQVGQIVESLPNRIAILGHTDGDDVGVLGDYTDWELSSERANAARRVLASVGVTYDRFSEVVGKANTEPLFPDSPLRPENRRITVLILREAPVLSPEFDPGVF
jgi:chemotaxis protein MotB